MFIQGGPGSVFLATRPVDFRKGSEEGQKTVRWTVFPTNGLALAVQEMFGLDPFCGAVFVFRSKRADRIKLLVWDQTGMVLVHKRLEDGKFVWPQLQDGVMRMSSAQMSALFEGLDWRLVRPERARRPLAAG
jgi:transposase